ncbi:MAG: protein-L-isoaspartate(D-aspartate) O-methyltransferase [Nitrospiraceae bacterium]|nr:protein-L-isoaspartate(D-aspartate) O-methyltransferase [Nitrospiraceae bacterium]
MNFDEMRKEMVDLQLILRGIKDIRVINAMRKVPRHLFVSEAIQYKAYDDIALPIGEGQTISQPYMVAAMTELLELKGDEKILEIGTGSGYQAAVLAELAKEVYTIERIPALGQKAEETFKKLKYKNIRIKIDDGTIGWKDASPFDRIIITAAAPSVPQPIVDQLSNNGIIVAPVGERFSQQLIVIKKSGSTLAEEFHTPCVFVPLIGKYGWGKEDR